MGFSTPELRKALKSFDCFASLLSFVSLHTKCRRARVLDKQFLRFKTDLLRTPSMEISCEFRNNCTRTRAQTPATVVDAKLDIRLML